MESKNEIAGYDIIGDIHGFADKLVKLLKELGYNNNRTEDIFCYSHPDNRIVIFLGDFIDGEKENKKVLQIVRAMVDSGNAKAVMGNHEYNALCFHTNHPDTGIPLRDHSEKNSEQHQSFLDEFLIDSSLLDSTLKWFIELPLFLELDGLRFVHACWDLEEVKFLENILNDNKLTYETLIRSVDKRTRLYKAIEVVLKGKEIDLPDDNTFSDKNGHPRKEIRVQWWEKKKNDETYQKVAVVPADQLKYISKRSIPKKLTFKRYPTYEPPVFFGHYWMTDKPKLLNKAKNAVCLDYSVARNGILCSYQWTKGDDTLSHNKFTYVDKDFYNKK